MVWFAVAIIVAIIVWIKEKSIGDFLLLLCVGCVVAFLVGLIVREIMPDQYEVTREEKLVVLKENDSYVTIMNNDSSNRRSNDPTAVFTVIGKDDAIITYKKSVSSSIDDGSLTIIETDSIEPKYVRQKMRPMYEYWELFGINLSLSKYVLYVPVGSIEYDYNVK